MQSLDPDTIPPSGNSAAANARTSFLCPTTLHRSLYGAAMLPQLIFQRLCRQRVPRRKLRLGFTRSEIKT